MLGPGADLAYTRSNSLLSAVDGHQSTVCDGGSMSVVRVRTLSGLTHQVETRGHRCVVDEPSELGGADTGPTPYELLLAALGTCMSITMQLYAQRKGWPLEGVDLVLSHNRIHAADCSDCDTKDGWIDQIAKRVTLRGPLTEEQRERLLEIGDRCPVRRTLARGIRFVELAEPVGVD